MAKKHDEIADLSVIYLAWQEEPFTEQEMCDVLEVLRKCEAIFLGENCCLMGFLPVTEEARQEFRQRYKELITVCVTADDLEILGVDDWLQEIERVCHEQGMVPLNLDAPSVKSCVAQHLGFYLKPKNRVFRGGYKVDNFLDTYDYLLCCRPIKDVAN